MTPFTSAARHRLPRQYDALVLRQFAELVERLVLDVERRELERRRPEVELALLERHEARRGEETAPTGRTI